MRTLSSLSLFALFAPAALAALRGGSNSHRSLASVLTSALTSHRSFAPMCGKAAATTVTEAEIQTIITNVRDELNAYLATLSTTDQAQVYATAFKLIFHDAAEADLRTDDGFGPDGCLSYSTGNSDLTSATNIVSTVIEPMWQKYCDKMSRADFWVLFAKLALEKADSSHSMNLPFNVGRKDATACGVSTSRLMDNQRGEADFFRVFLQQMDLSVNDAVALMGARSVGYHTGTQYSWDETPNALDNNYYKLLSQSSWKNILDVRDNAKHLWIQVTPPVVTPAIDPALFAADPLLVDSTLVMDPSIIAIRRALQANSTVAQEPVVTLPDPKDYVSTGSYAAMLNTDMALAYPIHTEFSFYYRTYVSREDDMCGPTMVDASTSHGCVGGGEEMEGWPYYTYDLVQRYAGSNSAFAWDFAGAFERLTTVGYNVAGRVIEEGKFGTLTPVQTISNAL